MNPSFLREAIRLAVESARNGAGGPFGAVIVRNDAIIARGSNRVTATNDPTAHAEIVAIREACLALQTFQLDGCEVYASCEPCPMCLAAIYWARLPHVYFAATRADAAQAGFDDDVIYRELALAPDQRSVTMQQALRDEALVAFEVWKKQADRVQY